MLLHASWLEFIFLAATLVYFGYALYAAKMARLNLRALRESKTNGARLIMADAGTETAYAAVAASLVMTLVSLLSLFLEPPPPKYNELPQSLAFLIGWVIVSLILSYKSQIMKSAREKLATTTPVEITVVIGTVQQGGDVDGRVQAMKDTHQGDVDAGDSRRATAVEDLRVLHQEDTDAGDARREAGAPKVPPVAPKVSVTVNVAGDAQREVDAEALKVLHQADAAAGDIRREAECDISKPVETGKKPDPGVP